MGKFSNVCVVMGQNVKRLRMLKGFSTKEFAKRFGVTVCELKKLEADKVCGFSHNDIPKLIEILDVKYEDILSNIIYEDD